MIIKCCYSIDTALGTHHIYSFGPTVYRRNFVNVLKIEIAKIRRPDTRSEGFGPDKNVRDLGSAFTAQFQVAIM